jgi:hypothetical protein
VTGIMISTDPCDAPDTAKLVACHGAVRSNDWSADAPRDTMSPWTAALRRPATGTTGASADENPQCPNGAFRTSESRCAACPFGASHSRAPRRSASDCICDARGSQIVVETSSQIDTQANTTASEPMCSAPASSSSSSSSSPSSPSCILGKMYRGAAVAGDTVPAGTVVRLGFGQQNRTSCRVAVTCIDSDSSGVPARLRLSRAAAAAAAAAAVNNATTESKDTGTYTVPVARLASFHKSWTIAPVMIGNFDDHVNVTTVGTLRGAAGTTRCFATAGGSDDNDRASEIEFDVVVSRPPTPRISAEPVPMSPIALAITVSGGEMAEYVVYYTTDGTDPWPGGLSGTIPSPQARQVTLANPQGNPRAIITAKSGDTVVARAVVGGSLVGDRASFRVGATATSSSSSNDDDDDFEHGAGATRDVDTSTGHQDGSSVGGSDGNGGASDTASVSSAQDALAASAAPSSSSLGRQMCGSAAGTLGCRIGGPVVAVIVLGSVVLFGIVWIRRRRRGGGSAGPEPGGGENAQPALPERV